MLKTKPITIGLVGVFVAAVFLFYFLLQPPRIKISQASDKNNKVSLEIFEGMGLREIASELKEKGLIRSTRVFKIYALFVGEADELKPGKYIFNPKLSVPALVGFLADGPRDIPVIIAPGMTVAEIDERLSSLGVINAGSLRGFPLRALVDAYYPRLTEFKDQLLLSNKEENNLEGFLFPDTYYFSHNSDAKGVVKKFLDNFEAKALPSLLATNNLPKTLILASLLEKEAPDLGNEQIIAGILEKRLAIGMPLQVDATIVYVGCGKRFIGCPALSESDYKINSPYNTYLHLGLPPRPISNPGLDAIAAASNPKTTKYLYYLSDPKTQKIIFANTLDEHNKNRTKYLLDK